MTQPKNIKVPKTKIPIIGEEEQRAKQEAEKIVHQVIQYLDSILGNLAGAIEELQKRVSVFDEMKTLMPSKIEVIVKEGE